MLTRLFLLSPPPGVSAEEFDRWYIGVHAQEARLIPAICRYVSWRPEQVPADIPGLTSNWYRLTEVGTANATAGQPSWTPPPYPQRTTCPTDWWEERTILVADKPEYDLLQETPEVVQPGSEQSL